MDQRQLSPYELTQLARHGIAPEDFVKKHGQQPIEQVTGHVDFAGLDFLVSTQVLIPRIETEKLVELAVEEIGNLAKKISNLIVAEVGTGCGAVIISIFDQVKNSNLSVKILASDISDQALEVARKNHQRLLSEKQPIEFFTSDLLKNYSPELKIDMLVANLPYIPTQRIDYLDSSVKDFEPRLALDGGADGLKLIKKLLNQAERALSPDGLILLEIDHTHDQASFDQMGDSWQTEIIHDEFSRNRFARIVRRHGK